MISRHGHRGSILFILITFLFLTTSCAKGAGLDRLTHKEVVAGSRKVLVNRFTDRVNYYWTDGRWKTPQEAARTTLQALYEKENSSR